MKIRRYKKSDLMEVITLHILALKSADAYVSSGKWDDDMKNIKNVYLKNGDFIIGLLNNKIVAMGAIRKISKTKAEIKRMRVHQKYQRKGFGQKIYDELEKRAIQLGFKKLQLDTTNKQLAAQKFYQKNGYKEFKRKYFKNIGFEMIYYEKIIKTNKHI